jgi:CspA family cold shock protein
LHGVTGKASPEHAEVLRLRVPAGAASSMASGTVKWFNAQKGYGFIQPSDGGKDVFVHISAVEQAGMSSLNEGQKVSYDVITTDRGRTAAGNLKAG